MIHYVNIKIHIRGKCALNIDISMCSIVRIEKRRYQLIWDLERNM